MKTALSYAGSVARIEKIRAAEDETVIHPLSHTKLWTHGERAPHAVIYFHGYTDSNQQFAGLAEKLFERGYNVFTPRLTHHGYRDRMHRAHGELTAPQLLSFAAEMTDAARGLGDTLTVIGLSLGGVLATWVAQTRGDIQKVLILSPAYGTRLIPKGLTATAAHVFKRIPNQFFWWNPTVRAETGNAYAYPQFSTHTLARLFLLANGLLQDAKRTPPAAHEIWMITNANDTAVNNALCAEFVAAWRAHQANVQTYEFPRNLGLPHDLLDPTEETAQSEVVYQKIIEIIEG